jgi:hypothetical protein
MKKIFCLILIALLTTACGSKGKSQTSFKILSGNLTTASVTTFPGGILIMGHTLDDTQSFVSAYTTDMVLELQKGDWEFATIGWMGVNPITGNQQCAYQRASVQTDDFTLSFNMSYEACFKMQTSDGKWFTDPLYYNAIGGTLSGFKKLSIGTCSNIASNCSTLNNPGSFRINIPAHNKGIFSSTALTDLTSVCVNGTDSALTPPHGGHGFIGLDITYFSGTACSGTAYSYHFNHGFGEKLDQTYVDAAGVTQTRRAVLSLDGSATNADIARIDLHPMGTWSVTNAFPTALADDLYMYTGATMLTVSPYPTAGKFILYNGTSWTAFAETANVKLILEEY